MKPVLVVLAAGMGSRYGGLKQIDPVGPSGEAILDYSVFDAHRAGFGKVVFIIRRDIEHAEKLTLRFAVLDEAQQIKNTQSVSARAVKRLNAAANLLIHTDLPIREVVSESGFGSVATFNRIFREHKHCTPTQYRVIYGI